MSSDTSTGTAPDKAEGQEHEDAILGKTIDGCKVVRKLGQGGMGVVYLAQHETLGQDFVLKILNPALTGAEDTVERFFREAQACAQLNHPGIVAIQNVGQEGDYYFIRMEYVKGTTLEDVVKTETQVEWKRATEFVVAVAEALSHAHQKGMIHRDIKPENIMLTPEGQIKVMDFGLAKHVHSSTKVSVTGQIVGTPFFMSPEQAGGKPTDARSDIYSLGVTLYYMVTGVKPFNGKNLQEIFLKHFFYAPESPKIYNEALPETLCEVVKRCLKKKKKERYQSAKAMARDLMHVLNDPDADLSDAAASSVVAPQPAGDDPGDKTIATGPAASDDDGGATVQVGAGAGDDEGGATVQVANGEEEKTIAVGGGASGGRRPRGEVKSVSFSSASMVFDDDKDSTLQIDPDDDEEDAHAGLDLPTSVINAAMGAEASDVSVPEQALDVGDNEEATKDRKKKILIVALVVLIPSLFFVGMHFNAKSKINSINEAYNQAQSEAESAAQVEEAHFQRLYDVAADYEEFRDGYILAPALTERAAQMAKTARGLADSFKKKFDQKIADAQSRERELELAEARKAELAELLGKVQEGLAKLEGMRKAPGADDAHWTRYTKEAFSYLNEFAEEKGAFKELQEYFDQVQIPVSVTSDPGGAQIFLNDNRSPEAQLTPPAGTGVVWVNPYDEFSIRVAKSGFDEFSSKLRTADEFHTFEASLGRKQLREPLSFGSISIEFGANKNMLTPVFPIHDPRVLGDGNLFFVDQAGLLRAFSTLEGGKMIWLGCPNGPGCSARAPNGETIDEVHRVGHYGDPAPNLEVAEDVILVSSLAGYVSAHDRSEGHRIWRANLDSPVTSPARYLPNNVVAAGTADGRIVFISEAGIVKKWSFQTENAVVSAPYLVGSLCIAGSTDNRLYAIDWKREKLLGRLQFDSDVVLGPVPVGARKLLIGTASGQVHLVEVREDGKLVRGRSYGDPVDRAVTGFVVAEIDGKRALLLSVGRNLHALDLETGKSLWVSASGKAMPFFNPGGDVTPPVVHPDGELIYVGGGLSGILFAIDAATGKEVWRFETPRAPDGSRRSPVDRKPVLVEDELFLLSRGQVFVLAPE